MIGDKGYIGRQHQINLFETAGIEVEVPLRSNQKEQKPVMCTQDGVLRLRVIKYIKKPPAFYN